MLEFPQGQVKPEVRERNTEIEYYRLEGPGPNPQKCADSYRQGRRKKHFFSHVVRQHRAAQTPYQEIHRYNKGIKQASHLGATGKTRSQSKAVHIISNHNVYNLTKRLKLTSLQTSTATPTRPNTADRTDSNRVKIHHLREHFA